MSHYGADFPGCFHAIHTRHFPVYNKKIIVNVPRVVQFYHLNAFFARFSHVTAYSDLTEDDLCVFQCNRIIVDYKYIHLMKILFTGFDAPVLVI